MIKFIRGVFIGMLIGMLILKCTAKAKEGIYMQVGTSLTNERGTTKWGLIGKQFKPIIPTFLEHKVEFGLYVAPVSTSGFGFYSLGIEPTFGRLFIQTFAGAGIITSTDDQNSGHFQFTGDLGIGMESDQGLRFSVNYKHISDAGITKPNLGRDLIGIRIQLPF